MGKYENKTSLSISKNLWYKLTALKQCGESFEDVILRLIKEGKTTSITDGMEDETEKINRLL